jgi:hypothetical protein
MLRTIVNENTRRKNFQSVGTLDLGSRNAAPKVRVKPTLRIGLETGVSESSALGASGGHLHFKDVEYRQKVIAVPRERGTVKAGIRKAAPMLSASQSLC